MKKTLLMTLFIAVFIYVPFAECRTKISVFRLKPSGGREAEDLSRAVQDILLSQLLEKDVVLPVAHDYVPADDREAGSRAVKDASDYAVTGGIAILGKSSNISIRLVDSKTSVPVHAESRQISKQEDIPDALDQMAKSIKTVAVGANATSGSDPMIPGAIVSVPEKKSAGTGTVNDGVSVDSVEKILLFKTAPVDERIISIAPVERSRGGGHEIIALTRNQIMIYKKTGKKLEMAVNTEAQAGQRNLRVDTGDTDGNGVDEIFITGINTTFNSPVSSIYEIREGRPYAVSSESGFFTASAWRNCHKVILRQREDNGSRLYHGDILQISGKSREPLNVPSGIFLDNFISGRITEKKSQMWLAFDSSDKLELINENGEAEWQGDEKFGGSMESIEKPMEAGKREDTERKYFRQRMAGFCDNSGKTYVITVKNEDMAKGLLSGFKKFTSGRIVILGWSDIGLKEIWASEKIPGGIHDIALFDADGDGLMDAVFASSIETTFKSRGFLAGIKLPENIAKMIK